jgi:signal transduction histidine kinase
MMSKRQRPLQATVAHVKGRDALVALAALMVSLLLSPPTMAEAPILLTAAMDPWVTFIAATLAVTPLLWRTSHPSIAFWATTLVSILIVLVVSDYRSVFGTLVCLFTVARQCRPLESIFALAGTIGSFSLVILQEVRHDSPDNGLATLLIGCAVYTSVTLAVWTAGIWAGRKNREVRLLEDRRSAAAHQAVQVERRRIARELHDIVAHTISLMTIQAAGARRVLRNDPNAAEAALSGVSDLGQRAIDELQRLLGVLRADGRIPEAEADATPGVIGIDNLIAQVQSAGIAIRRETHGRPGRLDPSVDTTAYRVIQESLTNVLKHAGSSATVEILTEWSPDRVVLQVTSDTTDARPKARLSRGFGLIGLRERTAAVGGRLDVSIPVPQRFQVTATLPRPGYTQIDGPGEGVHYSARERT